MISVEKIFAILGISSSTILLAFALLKYLSKNIFENYLAKQIETHKSELEKLNISHQVRFSALHIERAEIIKKIYHLLHDYKLATLDFFEGELNEENPEKHFEFKLNSWSKIVVELSAVFHKNKIFFSIEQVDLINSIHNEMAKINHATNAYLISFDYLDEQISALQNNHPKFVELKSESLSLVDRIMKFEKQLETEFRNLLGV